MLLLHGGLDPTVTLPRTEAFRQAFPAGQQVTPPLAGHVALNFSDCAANAYVQFIDTRGAATVSDCAGEAGGVSFDLDAATSLRLFGVEDAWGG